MARLHRPARVIAGAAIVAALAGVAGLSFGQAPRPAAAALEHASERAPPRDFSRARQSIVDYTRGVAAPALTCVALKTADFGPGLKVLSADAAPSAPGGADYCHVVGLIEGRIRVEVALPASWNRRLLQIGNGGVAGEAVPGTGERQAQRLMAVRNGFVFTTNDMGHVATEGDAVAWARDNPDAIVDFGHRAHHLNNLWARRVAERYYGNTVARAYYSGCSTGGRTGYAEAQRYPDDFDGILAGAPVYNLVKLSIVNTANSAVLARSGLTQDQYAEVGKRMLAKCDMLDGVKDGVISDPRACKFDVRTEAPVCGAAGSTPGQCLTPAQVSALAAIQPDVVVGGKRVYPGKILSSENMGRYLPSPAQPLPPSRETADMILRGMSLYPRNGPYPQLTWQTVDPARDIDRTTAAQAVLDSGNPDIAAFHAHGGKMITYIGWEDTGVNPRTIMEYWDAVAGRLGNPSALDTFRVFMVPGMGHCQGGAGAADYFDMMTPLIEWVEAGVAPQSVIGVKRAQDGAARFSRRLCPYPQAAKYMGGDSADAASYLCAAPAASTVTAARAHPAPSKPKG
jgi:hypothetical protein